MFILWKARLEIIVIIKIKWNFFQRISKKIIILKFLRFLEMGKALGVSIAEYVKILDNFEK